MDKAITIPTAKPAHGQRIYKSVLGEWVPVPAGDELATKQMIAVFDKARKFQNKMLKCCESTFTKGTMAFKMKAKTYLSSKRVLLANMFEDNARRPLDQRLSLPKMYELSEAYKILKCLNEPVNITTVPKSSGYGTRQITSFGPVARAAQRGVVKLLRCTYQPQGFQFSHLGSAAKVQFAMSQITQKGHDHVTEIDITDFYPRFTVKKLMSVLPLPKEAVEQIVCAKSALWAAKSVHTPHSYIPAPPGIPQGSASSSEVALWCIAQMKWKIPSGVQVVNHADNFFAFGSSVVAEQVSKALSAGITGLPGGDFQGKIEQAHQISFGFRMLGCHLWPVDQAMIAAPTDDNLGKLLNKTEILEQQIHAKLSCAMKEKSEKLRMEGVQDYLRLESLTNGWLSAFGFCHEDVPVIKADHEYLLWDLKKTYAITADELKQLRDRSTKVNVNHYSG